MKKPNPPKRKHAWQPLQGTWSGKDLNRTCVRCGVCVKLTSGVKGGLQLLYFGKKGQLHGPNDPGCIEVKQ